MLSFYQLGYFVVAEFGVRVVYIGEVVWLVAGWRRRGARLWVWRSQRARVYVEITMDSRPFACLLACRYENLKDLYGQTLPLFIISRFDPKTFNVAAHSSLPYPGKP